jgi:hypothetical protein
MMLSNNYRTIIIAEILGPAIISAIIIAEILVPAMRFAIMENLCDIASCTALSKS